MLILIHSTQFDKSFKTLTEKVKFRVQERLKIFVEDEFNTILNNHHLNGDYSDCKSINISGDIRLIYRIVDNNIRRLVDVGTHNQLFE